jgi:SNF2 family DNA or RNA helicase
LSPQCVNRIHRIGQTAPIVRIRKFIVKDSVEEQIMKMQHCKKGIADELYQADSGDREVSGSRLSLSDFKLIFRGEK